MSGKAHSGTVDLPVAIRAKRVQAEVLSFLLTLEGARCVLVDTRERSGMLSKRQLFYVTFVPFLVFYLLFAFFIYPMRDMIHALAGDSRVPTSACITAGVFTVHRLFQPPYPRLSTSARRV